jgi:hypothetical protein
MENSGEKINEIKDLIINNLGFIPTDDQQLAIDLFCKFLFSEGKL